MNNTAINNIFASWTGKPPVGNSECQLCGLPMDSSDRIPVRLKSEHPSSTRHVCDLCAKRARANNQLR